MDGLTIRQGTVYRAKASGTRLLLIHHDPMNLRSLLLRAAPGAAFDATHSEEITIDALIALRQSGEYTEEGDLTTAELKPLLSALLAGGTLSVQDSRLVDAVAAALF